MAFEFKNEAKKPKDLLTISSLENLPDGVFFSESYPPAILVRTGLCGRPIALFEDGSYCIAPEEGNHSWDNLKKIEITEIKYKEIE